MRKNASLGIIFALLLISMLSSGFNMVFVNADPVTIYVDDDNVNGPWDGTAEHPYQNITWALENATAGNIIFVHNGTYSEHMFVNETVSLVGENPITTILDGSGERQPIIHIVKSNVNIKGFTVQNTAADGETSGISVYKTQNVKVQGNIITKSCYGILLNNSTDCKIMDNKVLGSYYCGIYLVESSYNRIIGNSISHNPTGIHVTGSSQYNTFYRNNIVDNELQVFPGEGINTWDNEAEGNYWTDYKGIDLNGDGVGDTELPHVVDNYPLIEPWNRTRTYAIDSHKVVVNCNCTIASFMFNQSQKQISFYITGPTGWNGSCNVTVPRELLDPNQTALEKWIIMFSSKPLADATIVQNNVTLISFNYTLGASTSENRVRLKVGILYPPTADFSYNPKIASTIQPVLFTDKSEPGPNGTIVWRQWDFGDGNITSTNEMSLLHCYHRKELFNVTLTVKDSNNLTDFITKSVLVRNITPVANFTYTPSEPSVGEKVTFESTSEDPDGGITEYFWNFGDGTTSKNKTITTHTFKQAKPHKITLTVRDDEGADNSTTKLVLVRKGSTGVEVDAPITVKVEEPFTVNVTLHDCASLPLAGERIYIYDNNELILDKNTDSNGLVRTTVSLSIVGEHLIRAAYQGSLDYLGSNDTMIITVNLLNTTLTVNAPENATQNEAFTILATLNSENGKPVFNAEVEFYLHNGNSWESIGFSTTNQSGVASLNYTPQQVGTFLVKAVFNGSGMYAASSSIEYSITVVASEIEYFLYTIIAIVIVVIISVALIALRRRKDSQKNP